MSIVFRDTNYIIDSSGFTFGSGGTTTTLDLILDQRSNIPTSFTSFTIYDTDNTTPLSANLPFTIDSLARISNQKWTLSLTYDQDVANVKFGFNRKILLTANTGDTFIVYIQTDYANSFGVSSWTNANDITDLNDIDLRGPFTSISINQRLLALLHGIFTGIDQAKDFVKYYFYGKRYLSDIIDIAIGAGVAPETATGTITLNANGDIATLLINYSNRNILVTYTYSSSPNYSIDRMQVRDGITTPTPLGSVITSLLDNLRIDIVDGSNNIIYNLANVNIIRNSGMLSIPFLEDYDTGLSLSSTDTVALAKNMLADYKYYKFNTITGWTVTV